MNMKVTDPSGLEFAKKIVQTMKEETVANTKEDGYLYNIEEVPAESASGTLAHKDKLMCNGTYDYYDTQFVPLSYNTDLFDRLEIEGDLQEHCTGGSMCHLNLEGNPPENTLSNLTMTVLTKTKVRQFAFNKGFTVCKNNHVTTGINKTCPKCGVEAQDYITRVVGYFSKTSDWNKAKQKEFQTRKWSIL
jgi:ribonucleoside-triphosphate reductase (formate)